MYVKSRHGEIVKLVCRDKALTYIPPRVVFIFSEAKKSRLKSSSKYYGRLYKFSLLKTRIVVDIWYYYYY